MKFPFIKLMCACFHTLRSHTMEKDFLANRQLPLRLPGDIFTSAWLEYCREQCPTTMLIWLIVSKETTIEQNLSKFTESLSRELSRCMASERWEYDRRFDTWEEILCFQCKPPPFLGNTKQILINPDFPSLALNLVPRNELNGLVWFPRFLPSRLYRRCGYPTQRAPKRWNYNEEALFGARFGSVRPSFSDTYPLEAPYWPQASQ